MKLGSIQNRITAILDRMNDIVKSGRIEVYNNDLKTLLQEYKVLKSYMDLRRQQNEEEYTEYNKEAQFLLPRIPEEDVYGETKFNQRPQMKRLLSPEEFAEIKAIALENL